MADKKLEKALYGPSLTEVALGAVLGLICGVLVAGIYLVFKPVQQVKALPKEPSRAVVYYIPGSESSAKSRGWQAKERLLITGKSITVVEDELNAWGASTVASAPKPKPAAKPKAGEKPKEDEGKPPAPDGFVIPGPPNFKVVDDKVQVGMKCTLNWYGLTYDTTVVATGTFVQSGDVFAFKSDTFYLGSCPLHLIPAVSGPLVSALASKLKISDELRIALTKLSAVSIEKGAVTLSMP